MKKYKDKDEVRVLIGNGSSSLFINGKKGDRQILSDGTIVKIGVKPEEEREYIDRKLKIITTKNPIKKLILKAISKRKDKNIIRKGRII